MLLWTKLRAYSSVIAAAAVIGAAVPVAAQQGRAVGVTPPRLSFADGEVSYWRPGAEDWAPAQINTALAAGDSLYAGDGGNIEVEIGTRAYVRAGSGTELGIESLETGYLQLRVPAGHATVDLKRLPEGQQIELDTPNGAFLIDRAGYYRFDVDDSSTRFSSRRGGVARVVPAGGEEIEIGSSQSVVVNGTEPATIQRIAPVAEDAWDRWNTDRTGQLGEQPRSAQYVPPDVAGVDDLDRYGDWRETPNYGNVWVPRDVGADWAPYSDGRWVWDGYYGWTWVDDSPWGWAPYHYGRWCNVGGSWGWAPGPVAVRPVYAPALVAFFGGSGVNVSVSVGTPFVSWVALGWGEPVVPWWGPRGFVGRPYWGGWGGPRYVNNVQINNTTIINVNNINRYDNFNHRNAVIGVAGDRFGRGGGGRGRSDFVRVDQQRLRGLRPVRGEVGVRPVRESLVPRSGRGERPPDSIQNRRVTATRAPQDPARQPRASGLVPSESRRQPAPRIVTPRSSDRPGRNRIGEQTAPPPRGREHDALERGRGIMENTTRGGSGRSGDGRGNVGERGNGDPGRAPSRIDSGEGSRTRGEVGGVPEPPASSRRAPAERDRNGREQAPSSSSSTDRIRQQQRERSTREPSTIDQPPPVPGADNARGGSERSRGSRGNDVDAPTPPRSGGRTQERGRNAIQVPPDSSAPPSNRGGSDMREQGGRSRSEPPAPPSRNERPSRDDGDRSSRQPSSQRESAPPASSTDRIRQQQHERAPQVEQQSAPRMERQSAPRPERQAAPHAERQSAPHVERQEAPRQEAPRMDRGGGGGGGGADSRGGGSHNERGGNRSQRQRDQ